MIKLNSPFQWSENEQVWPFEKDKNGNTLYCKEVDLGAAPNASSKSVAHNISGLSPTKVHSILGFLYSAAYCVPLSYSSSSGNLGFIFIDSASITIGTTAAYWAADSAKARVIYSK